MSGCTVTHREGYVVIEARVENSPTPASATMELPLNIWQTLTPEQEHNVFGNLLRNLGRREDADNSDVSWWLHGHPDTPDQPQGVIL